MKKIISYFTGIEKDKWMHFAISLVLSLLVGCIFRLFGCGVFTVIAGSWFIGFGAGVIKELFDEREYGGSDSKDWLADVLGISLGCLFEYILMM